MDIHPIGECIVINAVGDSAYTHRCGAMVSPHFTGSGVTDFCPVCHQSV